MVEMLVGIEAVPTSLFSSVIDRAASLGYEIITGFNAVRKEHLQEQC